MNRLNWLESSKDGNGVTTYYPPQPKEYKDIPRCDLCGGLTQFKHFFPEVLPYLEPDEKVPRFCDTRCAMAFIGEKMSGKRGRKWKLK